MRKKLLGILIGLLAVSTVAFATITLNSQYVRTYQTGGVTTETDTTASATQATMDFPTQSITVVVELGSDSNGFVRGSQAPAYQIVIDARGGNVSGPLGNVKLTAAQQAAIESVMTNFQNQIENALVSWGVVPGTAVAN